MRLSKAGAGAALMTLVLGVPVAPAAVASTPPGAVAALPACPQVFGHGGYPTGAAPWQRDRIRQPNNPRALAQQKSWGADGVEADLQLTKDGTKGVMWHNATTNGLTGTRRAVTDVRWDTGADRLKGRTITRGPYAGQTVHTFRDWLDAARAKSLIPLVELKGEAGQSLLNGDATVRERAWREVIAPVKERIAGQEIMIYTRNAALKPELARRLDAAGLAATRTRHPAWVDGVRWQEPPPAAAGNHDRWRSTLDRAPRRVATSWTKDYTNWLKGKCA
ncbi:glycerophosphodiester phosphodiesterase family protein [Streptomyces sp. NPDC046261]|uniref:glycerophosphodiester phosphodiesterase family protein n=1 Tax=Streptomyces sp. NPDC046261 TaxID=3157200 RepID=UPI0033CF15C9